MAKIKCFIVFLCLIYSVAPFSYYNIGISAIKNRLEDIIERSGQKTDCAKDLKMLLSDFTHGKHWALKMVDASAKLNPGLMKGNLFHVGHYDECLEISERTDEGRDIKGQYCSLILMPGKIMEGNDTFVKNLEEMIMALRLDIPTTPQTKNQKNLNKLPYGVCLPASCTIHNLQGIWNIAEKTLSAGFHIKFLDIMCDHVDKPIPFQKFDVYIWSFFVILLLINLIATAWDYIFYKQIEFEDTEIMYIQIVKALSLYTNSKKLFKVGESSTSLRCLNGMRVLSMLWIVLGHRLLVTVTTMPMNVFDIIQLGKETAIMLIVSGPLAVDTFLFIGGFLVPYVYYSYKKQGIHLSVFHLFLGRLMRLIPSMLVTIAFLVGVWKYMGSGPYWRPLANVVTAQCIQRGWRSLFFIDNFFPLLQNCLPQTWYTAVDSQFFIFSPVLLYLISTKTTMTILGLSVIMILSSIYTYFLTLHYKLGAVTYEITGQYFDLYYTMPQCRLAPWVTGFICGYMYFKLGKKLHINKVVNLLIWAICIGCLLWIMFPLHKSFHMAKEYDPVKSALFNALVRPVWGLCMAWIVIACCTGHGGFINTFLSNATFTVLARLTYSFYLTHSIVIYMRSATKRTPSYISALDSIYDTSGDLAITLVLSTILSLTTEAPSFALKNIFFKPEVTPQIEQATKATNTKRQKKKKQVIFCILPEDLKDKHLKKMN